MSRNPFGALEYYKAHSRGNLFTHQRPQSEWQPSAYITLCIVAAGFVLSMAATLPGELSYDSVIQLLEGRTAAYSGWHPPIMSWLLGLSDSILPGAALFVCINALLLFGAMVSLPWIVPRHSRAGPGVALVCILLPQVLIYQGTVWKDVLFANTVIAGFVLLAHATVRWNRLWLRLTLLAAAFLVLIVAALARQNGAILLVAASASVFWISRNDGESRMRAITRGSVVFVVAILGVIGCVKAFSTRIVPDRGAAKQIRILELYDLVGALKLDPGLRLPELRHTNPRLLDAMRTDGRKLYSPTRSDTLARSERLQNALMQAPNDVLQHPWVSVLLSHSGLYLRVRAEEFRWVLLTPDLAHCVPYVVGFRGPQMVLEKLRMNERFTRRDEMVGNYGRMFIGTPAFSHATYLLLAILELAFLLRRRCPADPVFAVLLLGSFAFCASFFFVSIACDYRYLYLLDLSALITLLYIAIWPCFDVRVRAVE